MPINDAGRERFIYLGATANTDWQDYSIAVPYPTAAPFETARLVDSGRNANGTMVGRMVGRSIDKVTLSWEKIACEDWWHMNRWFEAGHFTFYCHYFSHNTGRWITRLYYLGNVKVEPQLVREDGQPSYYRNASFSLVDCGY